MINLTIATLRKEKKVTQAELASFLGVTFQTISKWENGITMPDVSVLPLIAKYFNVSTDEILGLKPLKNQYISSAHRQGTYWDKKLEYLRSSRSDLWNDDYLEFLVSKVWKINKPVDIADFGCGYGYLGMKLLPLLPEGSSYTGIDFSKTLLEEASLIFKDQKYNTKFINHDLNESLLDTKYDIVLCQAFLRHLSNPKEMLDNMIKVCKTDGLVVCIEVNRVIENAGLYIHNHSYAPSVKSSILKKHWDSELSSEGRDYSIGQKLPCYMRELGLKNVAIRLNDSVTFIDPDNSKSDYDVQLQSLKETQLWDHAYTKERKELVSKLFMSRGMTKTEIDSYINIEESSQNFVNGNPASIVKTLGLLISYGRK